VALTKVVKDFP